MIEGGIGASEWQEWTPYQLWAALFRDPDPPDRSHLTPLDKLHEFNHDRAALGKPTSIPSWWGADSLPQKVRA